MQGFNSKHKTPSAWTVFLVLLFSLSLPSDYRLRVSSKRRYRVLPMQLPYLTLLNADNYLIISVTETFLKLILMVRERF